jgi:tetratricopeptide (TPR) repeat protein
MNLLLHLIVIVLTLSLTLGCARTQSSRKVCLELGEKANQSFGARDWEKYIKDSKNYIESCRNVLGSESISTIYSLMAAAFVHMGQPNDAVNSANLCSSTYYANPDCHFYKAWALLQLRRFEEAKNSLNIAERTAKHELSVIDSYIIASRYSEERELYVTKKMSYIQTLNSIELFRSIFFPKE